MATATKPSNNPPVTKPVVKEIEEKKGKAKHPLVGSADKNVYPFKELPKDFDVKKFQSLKKKDFASEAPFFDYRAYLCDVQAAEFRSKAQEARTVGDKPKEDQKLMKKVIREAAKLKELQAILSGKGIDVNKLIAEAQSKVAAAAPTA